MPLWEPSYPEESAGDECKELPSPDFPTVSVRQLMESNTRLLASSGKELSKPTGIFQNAAEVKKARKAAMGQLGLDFLDDVADGDDMMDIDKDLAAADEMDGDAEAKSATTPLEDDTKQLRIDVSSDGLASAKREPASAVRMKSATPGPSEDDMSGLSARERNRLKRKRKPGNSAFVAAPPPQASGSKYNTAAGASSTKYAFPFSTFVR